MIESTKAFQQFANNKSWAQLDFQTQQQIRLFAILEQAATKYGVEVGNNAISATARFTAQLNNLKLAIGQAFKPIWEAVLPGLTAMVAWLTRAANAVAQFMTVLFGKAPVKQAQTQVSVNNQVASSADSIGDSYKQAGKEAKKAAGSLAAFDEINSLAEKSMSGGDGLDGGAGGGLLGDITSVMPSITPVNFETNALEISEKIKELATKFKEYLKPLSPYVEKVKTSFNNLKTAISDLVSIPALQKFVDFMKEKSIDLFKGKLLELSGRFDMLAGFIETVSAVLSGDWEKALKGNEKIIGGLYDTITAKIYPFFPEFAKKMEEFKANFSEKWASLKEEVRKYGDPAKLEALDFGKYIAVEVTKKFAELVINTRTKFQELKNAISEKWELIKTDIAWNDVKNNLLLKWDELKTNSAAKWDSIKATLSEKWGLIKSTIGWSDVKNTLVSHWEALKTSTGTKWSELKTVISNKWDDIKSLKLDDVKIGLINIWNGLKTETEIIWRAIEGVIKQGINSVLDLINSLIDKMNSVEIKIPSVNIPGMGKIGGNSIKLPTIPKLPKLARGGIVDGTSNMGNYIAGEAGAEMIVPLENTSFVDKLASALGTAVMSAMSFSNESANNKGDIILQIDGVTLGRVMNPYLTKENNRVGTPVIKTI